MDYFRISSGFYKSDPGVVAGLIDDACTMVGGAKPSFNSFLLLGLVEGVSPEIQSFPLNSNVSLD